MPLKLIIADDHPLLVNGLVSLLSEMEDVQILEPASSGRQLIERLRKTPADIALVDLNMPQLDGIATLKILRKDFPALKVIVFTNYHQPKLITEIRNLAAKGYVMHTSNSIIVKEAISTVAQGKTWFGDEVTAPPFLSEVVDDFSKRYQITKREVEILRMIAEGLTTRQIGERLFVSEF